MFLIAAESPTDVSEVVRHLEVQRCLVGGVTKQAGDRQDATVLFESWGIGLIA